ncbi:MAG: hypothetical protein HRT68_09015 [Flavobacteriaceae bacterium]|nr:hypothetical protein [Flavobacteriaceae bacterium]
MKKILALLVLTFSLAIGTQTATAQEMTDKEIQEYAAGKATELQKQFGLNENQTSQVQRAYYQRKLNYSKYLAGKENDPNYNKYKNKIDSSFNYIVKRALGEENYKTFVKKQEE